MVTINLLPWRHKAKQYQCRIIQKMSLFSLFSILFIIVLVHWCLTNKQTRLFNKVHLLQKEWRLLLSHHNRRVPFKSSQPVFLIQQKNTDLLLNELMQPPQPGLCFTEAIRNKNNIVIQGEARSLWDLLQFLEYWRLKKTIFSEVRLDEFRQKNKLSQFSFHVLEYS